MRGGGGCPLSLLVDSSFQLLGDGNEVRPYYDLHDVIEEYSIRLQLPFDMTFLCQQVSKPS